MSEAAAAQSAAGSADDDRAGNDDEILVLGRLENGAFDSLAVEDELGEADIQAYGQDTVGDLLADIGADFGDDEEGPVVLVNGELATGLDEIETLPSEALAAIQLLPRQAAGKLGQRPGRRVLNIVLKRNLNQITLTADNTLATAGEGRTTADGGTLTRLAGGNRLNLNLRVRDVAPLLEVDRKVLTRTSGVPYDLTGNLVPFPAGPEIDPALSALAGHPVTVAAVPAGVANPTLAQFAAGADSPNVANIGRFRSLSADSRNYAFTGSLTRRLAPGTSLTAALRGDVTESERLSNSPAVLLRVPAASPFSPFGRDVAVARYLPLGLEQRRDSFSLDGGLVLNHNFAEWTFSVSANYAHRDDDNRSDSATDTDALQAGVAAGTINPFAPIPADLLQIVRVDRSVSKTDRASLETLLSGPLIALPAGPVRGAFRLGGALDRLAGFSTFTGARVEDRLNRREINGQASLDIPLNRPEPEDESLLGELSANLFAGFREANIVGRLASYGAGFAWRPRPILALRGSLNQEERPPSVRLLQDPVEIIRGVRFFDVLRDETVEVTLVTGGNPALPNEKRQVLALGATITPETSARRNLTVEYTRTRVTDAQSELPHLSQVVQDAFGDRFVRDPSGTLVLVDSRPVTLARDLQELLRTAVNFSGEFGAPLTDTTRRLGQSSAPAASEADEGEPIPAGPSRRTWRYNLSLSANWFLTNERLVRPGIPIIDLLDGGAVGYGGGQPRQLVQLNAGVSGKGLGLQLAGRWRAASMTRLGAAPSPADLRFSPRTTINLRTFADLGTVLPDQDWAKGARLTLAVTNLFDSAQRVHDGNGETPLRYQRYLLDPLGRTISINVRKVF